MKNICVFGSSSEKIDRIYHDTAESLGSALVKKGYSVIFGAGKYGVMGATAFKTEADKDKNGSIKTWWIE